MIEIDRYRERGDGPAQAILRSNSHARAIRKAAETQEELMRIQERVIRTLDTYDLSEKLSAGADKAEVDRITDDFIREQANLEFIDDMTQLMVILSDPVAKRKYQQQVTVFIVGFENLCGRRAKLLAQLQEFFVQNISQDDKFELDPPEFDLDDVGLEVREALGKAEKVTERLANVSRDVLKALELANPKETKKGKKKLEKALHQSHQDIMSLTEKLLKVQSELDQNEGKMSQVYKSLEMKQVEIERLRVQVDNAKKYAEEINELKIELSEKEREVQGLTKVTNELELNIAQLEDKLERDYDRHKKLREENEELKKGYEEKLKDQQNFIESIQSDLKQHYDAEVKKLRSEQELALYYLRQDHETQLKRKERVIATTKKKNEELIKARTESLSETSPQNSQQTGSPQGKFFTSPFSPDSSEGEYIPSRLSLKSSAQSIRMMLHKSGTEISSKDSGGQSPLSDRSKESTPSRSESVRAEKTTSDLKEKTKTPEVEAQSGRRSKSPQKTVQVRTPEEQMAEEKAKETIIEKVETSVERRDASVQSDAEEAPDIVVPKPILRRTSTLQVVHEQDFDSDEDDLDWATLSPEELLSRAELFKAKSLKTKERLERELSEWKTKYLKKTDALRQEACEAEGRHIEEKESLLKKMKEAESLKEQAEREAEQAILQLEEILAEQEEMRRVHEKSIQDRREEQTMTGLSLRSRQSVEKRERDTMTGISLDGKQALQSDSHHSFVSRGVSPFPIIESSTQEDTVAEDHAEYRGVSPRDSGFEGAGSSVKFDSRPVSGSSNVNVLSPQMEKEEGSAVPGLGSRSSTLTAPRRDVLMSARARRRLVNSALRDHPIASETLRTYEAVQKFKENIAEWLEKQGLFVEVNELTEMETAVDIKDDLAGVIERLPEIRYGITQVLDKVHNIISSQTLSRGSPMSDIRTHAESTKHESTELDTREPADEPSSDKQQIESSYSKLLKEYNDLAEGYERLKKHFDEETKFHQEQTSQNATVMADMQDTINNLKLQLNDALAGRSLSPGRANSSVMFSRLDAERNSKILKRAINENRVTDDDVTQAFDHMSDYVSLPAKRLAVIVQRYRHHHAMQEIEKKLKSNSANLDENVLLTLEKMELLQNDRARRWGEKMDELAERRERLAQLMMETFERLENNTGIFLIKPVLSYKTNSDPLGGYLVSKKKPMCLTQTVSTLTPAPTPWLSNGVKSSMSDNPNGLSSGTKCTSSIPQMTELKDGVIDMGVTQPCKENEHTFQGQTWQVSKSQVNGTPPLHLGLTTPRMLELDVNRMMVGQTQASTGFIGGTTNIPSSLIRSYVTVERPSGSKQVKKAKKTTDTSSDHPLDPMVSRMRTSPSTMRYSPLPPIRMPDLRQESRSSKSVRSYPESEGVTQSLPGSPDYNDRPGQRSPTSRPTTEERLVLSPDVIPVK